ncbi:MAG TPA: pseudouridine synthase [Candidatus Acidoferrales bacterium]|nr:pseudouridine synthase [Candidatus Acidoferrales bacterium]
MAHKDKIRRVGLARALSKMGYCSRSRAFELIRAGRVRVNDTVKRDPEFPVRFEHDPIEVDGKEIRVEGRVYLMLNKPRGIITTAADEKGRETVYAKLADGMAWVAPVGRLDKASEGLLLLTNDSEWASRVTAPETHLDKTYHVQVNAIADAGIIERLKKGVRSESGQPLRVKRAEILRRGEKNSWFMIVLDEGKNRQIRRVFEALGIEVLRLVRVAIGPLALGELPKGNYRSLTTKEKQMLDSAMERGD